MLVDVLPHGGALAVGGEAGMGLGDGDAGVAHELYQNDVHIGQAGGLVFRLAVLHLLEDLLHAGQHGVLLREGIDAVSGLLGIGDRQLHTLHAQNDVLQRMGLVADLRVDHIGIDHNETANIQSKAQAFNTLMASGLHPELAMAKSGISNDPVKDAAMSSKYIEMIWGNPTKVIESEQTNGGNGEANITESDNNNGENDTGGAV